MYKLSYIINEGYGSLKSSDLSEKNFENGFLCAGQQFQGRAAKIIEIRRFLALPGNKILNFLRIFKP